MSIRENGELTYEQAIARLEEIVKLLEQRDLELDEAISLYEEGLSLIHYCENKLKEAKTRVEVILKTKDGYVLESLERAREIFKNGQ